MFFTRATRVGGLDTHYITPKGMKEGIEENYTENTDFIVPNSMIWCKHGVGGVSGPTALVNGTTEVFFTGTKVNNDNIDLDSVMIMKPGKVERIGLGTTIRMYGSKYTTPSLSMTPNVVYMLIMGSSSEITQTIYRFEFDSEFTTCSTTVLCTLNLYTSTYSHAYLFYVSDEHVVYADAERNSYMYLKIIPTNAKIDLSIGSPYDWALKQSVGKVGNSVYILIKIPSGYSLLASVVKLDISSGLFYIVNAGGFSRTGGTSSYPYGMTANPGISFEQGFVILFSKKKSSGYQHYWTILPYELPSTEPDHPYLETDSYESDATVFLDLQTTGLGAHNGRAMLAHGSQNNRLYLINIPDKTLLDTPGTTMNMNIKNKCDDGKFLYKTVESGSHYLYSFDIDNLLLRVCSISPELGIRHSLSSSDTTFFFYKHYCIVLWYTGGGNPEIQYIFDTEAPVFYKTLK